MLKLQLATLEVLTCFLDFNDLNFVKFCLIFVCRCYFI